MEAHVGGSKARSVRLGLLIGMGVTAASSASAQMVQIEGVPFVAMQVITRTTPAGTTHTQGKMARNRAGSTYVEEIDPTSGVPRRAFIFDVPGRRLITLDLARHSFRVRAAPEMVAKGVPLGWVGDQLRWAEAHRDRSVREVQGSVAATQTWLGTRQVGGLVTVGTLRERRALDAGEDARQPAAEVAESWFSVELGLAVLMTDTKPGAGQITEVMLTDVLRTEPEPSLFAVPPTFTREGTSSGGQTTPVREADQGEPS